MVTWQASALGIFRLALVEVSVKEPSGKEPYYILRNLFCDMSDTVNSADCECPVQHACNECESVWVTSDVAPVFPHEVIWRISCTILARHNSTDQDCNNKTNNDEERADSADERESPLAKHHSKTTQPGDDQIANKHMPTLRCEVRMVECVWIDNHASSHGTVPCYSECPRKAI